MTKQTKGIVYSIVALVLIISAGFMIYQRNSAKNATDAPLKKTPMVAAMVVQPGSIQKTIETTGTVEAENAISIIPKVEQRIVWMPFKEGNTVRQGQVLARLDSTESGDQLSAALAEASVAEARLKDVISGSRPQEIKSAKASFAQAETNFKQASRDLEHTRKLYGSTGIPEQQLQEAQSRYDSASANVESAEATVEDAAIELERLKKMLNIGGVSQEDVDKAQTRYQVTRSSLTSAKSSLTNAKSNLEHVRELNVKVIPEQQIDNAEAKYSSMKSALEAAKAKLDLLEEGASSTQIVVAREIVRQARLKAQTIRTQADYYTIKSPISGVITKLHLSEGDMAQTKQPIMSISEKSQMIVKAALTDRDAAKISQGRPVMVKLGGLNDKPIKLKVTRIYPSADTVSRLVPIEIALPSNIKVSQGSFARVSLVIEKRDGVVVIPSDVVVQKPGGKNIAFIVENNKAYARPIETGIESNGRMEILSGIDPGETLVIKGQEMLKDGAEVKVKTQNKSSKNGMSGSAGTDELKQDKMKEVAK